MAEECFDRTFLGRGWSFPPHFARHNKGAVLVAEEEDIRQSLQILFSTAPGERVMYPEYGCGLKRMVFHNTTLDVITRIKDLVERAVLFHEPRIKLNDVVVDTSSIFEGLVEIKLDYTVRSTNSRSNMVYPFYLLEGTNIRR